MQLLEIDAAQLTDLEQQDLAAHEAVIERGLKTFVDVGQALLSIRDGRLYRTQFGTFEDYCRERWGMSQPRAYQMMSAAQTVGLLRSSTIVELPQTESQARPLTQLPPDIQPIIWQRAVETAPNGKITAAHVQSVVDDYRTPPAPEDDGDEEPEPRTCFNCWHYVSTDDDRSPGVCALYHGLIYGPLWLQANDHQAVDCEGYTEEEPDNAAPAVYQPMAATVYSHRSVEYYTPVEILEAARDVLGAFDLDPASCPDAQENVRAARYFIQDEDGLTRPWYGRVWLNPPYGKTNGRSNQEAWSQRLVSEYQAGHVTGAILLVKAALGYKWFEELFSDWPVCFVRSRLSFILESGDDDGQSKQGTALFYFGDDFAKFAQVFRAIGRIIPPEDQLDITMFG